MAFTHLHLHDNFSFLEWLGKPKQFIKQAKELWMTALAQTNSWNLYGSFEFYKYCKEFEIKPIIWLEAYISKKWMWNKDKDNEFYNIVLLAKNLEWYKNLIELTTNAYLHGFYYKPRIDFDLLKKFWNNLIALSGCTLWEIPQHIVTGKKEEFIVERIKFYQELFWEDNFYLELQEHPDRWGQWNVNDYLVKLARKHWFKIVATNDCHYVTMDDAEAQDLLFCIWDWRALEDPDRPTLIEWNYSLRSEDEMKELFVYAPEAIETTQEIVDKINLEIPYGKPLIPQCELNEEEKIIFERFNEFLKNHEHKSMKDIENDEWYLRYMCFLWLNNRFEFWLSEEELFECVIKLTTPPVEKKLSEMSPEELKAISNAHFSEEKNKIFEKFTDNQKEIVLRVEYELTVVDLMWFNWYLVIVADFINWAKNNWVPVWPWRWSAAGSMLAYLSWITDINPLEYWLLFERFLNPARVSMPDIDTDFSDEWRDKVLEYVRNKYWADHVAQICTFWTMAARAAVKDVGKVLGFPFTRMNEVAKLIPSRPWIKIKEALEESVEFKQLYDSDPQMKKVVDNAIKLEWSVRQLWVHACAVIIAPEPMTNFCALQNPPKDNTTIITQLSQYPLEDLGLLKMDFLWLKNLAIIKRCIDIVERNTEKKIDLLKINYDDQKVFDVYSRWDTTWVFQVESPWMRKYFKELKPNRMEDIIVMLSLYRPGPLQYIPTYINRKNGKEKVEFPHPSLEKILEPTQWIAVYQEQIMQLVQAFAWFSLWEADILRRAIWKKKIDLLMQQKEKFVDAAKKEWHPEKLAKYIFEDIIEPFAGYWFNKSHAACYAVISYQTAYLKAYYPTEFMTALMVSDEEDMDRIKLEIEECKMKWINILPPDVNESMKHFTYIDSKNIRFWLKAVKWLWDWPIDAIRNWRKEKKYETIIELIEKTWWEVINKKSLEALAYAWALDTFWERASIIASIPKITAYLKEHEKKKSTSQIGFFDMVWDSMSNMNFTLEKAEPMTFEQKITWEKTTIWYSVTGHLLDWLKKYIEYYSRWLNYIDEFRVKFEEIQHKLALAWEVEVQEEWQETEKEETKEEKKPEEQKEKKKWSWKRDEKKVRYIWVITNLRKVQTKKWTMMIVALCESFNFKFTILVFPKDYDKFQNLLVEDKIVMIDGRASLNETTWEISVSPDDIKLSSVDKIRAQAMWYNLFDENDKVSFLETISDDWEIEIPVSISKQEEKSQDQSPEVELDFSEDSYIEDEQKEIEPDETVLYGECETDNLEDCNPTCCETKIEQEIEVDEENEIAEYIIQVPTSAKKQDLLDLKSFLVELEKWDISIKINVNSNIIDTKMSVANLQEIKDWEDKKWK